MKKRIQPLLSLVAMIVMAITLSPMNVARVMAQESAVSISRKLSEGYNDKGSVYLQHSRWIGMMLYPSLSSGVESAIRGYRIQIYSSNDPMRGKREAMAMRGKLSDYEADLSSYLIYQAPFWRVRVGNYKYRSDAQRVLSTLRTDSNLKGLNMYVVPDSVSISPDRSELLRLQPATAQPDSLQSEIVGSPQPFQ